MRKNKHSYNDSINSTLNNAYGKKGKRRYKSNYNNEKIKKILTVILIIVAIFFIYCIGNEFIIINNNEKVNLIINNNNITSDMKNDILIQDNIIYLSEPDIENFFDKHIYEEPNSGKIITTYDKKIAEVSFDSNIININGSDTKVSAHAIKQNNITYLPISEMKDVYGIEIEKIDKTNIITMDSTDREQIKCTISRDCSVKYSTDFFAYTVDRVATGQSVIKIKEINDGWTKIRTANGKIGYVKSDKLTNEIKTRENMNNEVQIDGKVNMFWDYFSKYASAPDRSGTKIDGVNVVSPAFFYLDESGNLKENIGDSGKKYIEWAHNNGYRVWPMVENAEAGIEVTSKIMNSYENRKKLIEAISEVCVKYNLDGVNIDFENMKEADKEMYSRFIIELSPRIKDTGDVISVDVTAPDGGETWSLCFDRNVIGNEANYIIFMAYDEYGTSSTKPGTTAGFDWVKLSLNKFLETEEIESNKIILGIPFYTRLWAEDSNGNVANKMIYMKDEENIIPEGVEKTWKEDLQQYYIEFQKDKATLKMWIEDEKSLKSKLSLIKDNNLAGLSAWAKGMEDESIWQVIKEELQD